MSTDKKPTAVMVPLLDLDDCLTYAEQLGVLTSAQSGQLIDYAKELGIEAGYYDLHWEDIEDENGMPASLAKALRKFYGLFKEHEVRLPGESPFPHLHFDISVYT